MSAATVELSVRLPISSFTRAREYQITPKLARAKPGRGHVPSVGLALTPSARFGSGNDRRWRSTPSV
jgi:hypothetical protein